MNWKNIGSNIFAVYVFAESIYPGLDGRMILASIQDGSILTHLFNLGLAYIAFMYGKDETRIRYITE